MSSISVIIPTYNRKNVLYLTLLSLYKQTVNKPYEIIVVDDGSIDGTAEMVQEMAKTAPISIKYFFKERGRQREAPKARNIGAKNSKYERLVFLDQDEIASPLLLQKLTQSTDKYIYTTGLNLFLSIESLKRITKDVVLDAASYNDGSIFAELRGPGGMVMSSTISNIGSVWKDMFWEVGGFDEAFIGYGYHDADLQNRLERIGCLKSKINDACAFHIAHTSGKVSAKAHFMYELKSKEGKYNKIKNYMTIILPVKNQIDYFEKCFASLIKLVVHRYAKILIIDDGSNEANKKKLEEFANGEFKEWIILHRFNKSIGLTKCFNFAVKKMSSNYFLFVNSDTIFSFRSIAEMMHTINIDKGIGVVGPTTSFSSTKQRIDDFYPTRYDVIEKYDDHPSIFRYVDSLADKIYNIYVNRQTELELDGFCFLAKGIIFDKAGVYFDEIFEGPKCEVDWQRRARKSGYRSFWAQSSYVHHFGRRTYYTEMGKQKADLLWAKAGLQLKRKKDGTLL